MVFGRLAPFRGSVSMIVAVLTDLLLVAGSYAGAHLLRGGGAPPPGTVQHLTYALPAVAGAKVAVLYQLQAYRVIWPSAGTPDLARLLGASAIASGVVLTGQGLLTGSLSVSLVVIDGLLATLSLVGWRMGLRALQRMRRSQRRSAPGAVSVLIYGADHGSTLALRHLRRSADPTCTVVGFLDPARKGLRVQGLPVVGAPDDVEVDALVLPSIRRVRETLSEEAYSHLCERCSASGIPCYEWSVTLDAPSPNERRIRKTGSSSPAPVA